MQGWEVTTLAEQLEKSKGGLAELLFIEDFAEPGKLADQLAKKYKNKLKTTQLRRIFHVIKAIERGMKGRKDEEPLNTNDRREILQLLPELAYARGRDLIPQDFYKLMSVCLSSAKQQKVKDFRTLSSFLTAILAYHKYYE